MANSPPEEESDTAKEVDRLRRTFNDQEAQVSIGFARGTARADLAEKQSLHLKLELTAAKAEGAALTGSINAADDCNQIPRAIRLCVRGFSPQPIL
jgi:hypothetical protein